MKKLCIDNLTDAFINLKHFNKYHKTKFKTWTEYFLEIGFKAGEEINKYTEYEKYSIWFDLINTPLMKALSENKE